MNKEKQMKVWLIIQQVEGFYMGDKSLPESTTSILGVFDSEEGAARGREKLLLELGLSYPKCPFDIEICEMDLNPSSNDLLQMADVSPARFLVPFALLTEKTLKD